MCGCGVIRTTPATDASDGKGITSDKLINHRLMPPTKFIKECAQHRGEDACGITSHCEDTGIHQQKFRACDKVFLMKRFQNLLVIAMDTIVMQRLAE